MIDSFINDLAVFAYFYGGRNFFHGMKVGA